MGYGALTDEQTGPAMERNKFLGKNLSTTCRLGKNTKAVKTKAPHRVAKGHKKRKNMHDMAPRKCVQTIDCGSNAQSLLHTLYRRHVHFANGWKTVQWPFFCLTILCLVPSLDRIRDTLANPKAVKQYTNTSRAGQAGGGSFQEKKYKSKKKFAYRMCTG